MSAYDFVQHGQKLVDAGQHQEAVKVCRLGLLAHPTALAGRLVLGNALIALRRYDEVLAEMRVALEIDGTNARALALKGEALLYKGDAAQAAQVLNQAHAYAPSDKRLAILCRQAESLIAASGPYDYARSEPSDSMTKHYPVQDELDEEPTGETTGEITGEDPESYTRPDPPSLLREPGRGLADDYPVEQRTNTIEIDPSIEAYELVDPADSMVREFDEDGFGERSAEKPTAHYRRLQGGDGRPVVVQDDDDDLTEQETKAFHQPALKKQAAGRAPQPQPQRPPQQQIDLPRPKAQPSRPEPVLPPPMAAPPSALPRPQPMAAGAPQPALPRPQPMAAPRPALPPPMGAPQPALPRPQPVGLPQPVGPSPEMIAAQRRTAIRQDAVAPPPGGPPPAGAPAMNELFPEDETGISRMAQVPSAPPRPTLSDIAAAVQQKRAPNQPTLAISTSAAKSAAPRSADDMRLIRAGLGLDPEGREAVGPPKGPMPNPAPMVGAMPMQQPGPMPPQMMGMPPQMGMPQMGMPGMPQMGMPGMPQMGMPGMPPQPGMPQQPASRMTTSATSRGQRGKLPNIRTASVAKKRSVWVYALYAIIALAVVAGGVFAGFEIRELRLDREISATQRDALSYAQSDTYDGYLRARAAYAGIVSVRSNKRTRAALARMQAAIAAEFGDGFAEAKTSVERLGGAGFLDAAVARAYLALAAGDPDIARLRAADVEKSFPDEPIGPYLRGRVALLANRPDEALDAFTKALAKGERPFFFVGLGRAHLARGALPDAGAAFERALALSAGHPEAVMGRAELALTSLAAEMKKPDSDLETIISDDGRGGTPRVSTRQRARAALDLALLELLRGDPARARTVLGRVSELMPTEDRYFTRDYIRALLAIGDLESAEKEAKAASTKWPDAVAVRAVAAEVSLAREDARVALATLEGDISSDARALIVRARARLALGELEPANKDLDAAQGLASGLTDLAIVRAEVDLYTGNASAALTRVEPLYGAMSSPTAAPWLGVVYAAALRDTGNREKARELLDKLVSWPQARRAYLELARLERAEGKFEKARDAYEQAIAQAPKSLDARLEAALLWLDLGRIKNARIALETLAKENPENGRVLIEAARVLTLTGEHSEAERLLGEADKAGAPKWQVSRERGRLAFRRGDRKLAIEELTTARNLEMSDPDSRLLLLYAQISQDGDTEDLEPARKTVEEALKHLAMGLPKRDMARARLDLAEDRLDDALKAYRQARTTLVAQRATPRDIAEVDYWIGRTHFLADRLPLARKTFKLALKRDPGHADAHFYLGLTHMFLDALKPAEDALKLSLDIDPAGNPEAWFYLGETRHKRKRWKEARQAFQEYIKRSPSGTLVQDARDYLSRMR